jgi:hypothetical protein
MLLSVLVVKVDETQSVRDPIHSLPDLPYCDLIYRRLATKSIAVADRAWALYQSDSLAIISGEKVVSCNDWTGTIISSCGSCVVRGLIRTASRIPSQTASISRKTLV